MGRPARDQTENSFQHVMVRGNDGGALFTDDADRESFLGILRDAGGVAEWQLLTYCLMTTHAHLLVQLGPSLLSTGMHRLASTYAHRFNKAHGRTGHVFGNRFHAVLVEDDDHLREALRYIALNPWRAGMTRHRDAWTWSAHRALCGLDAAPAMLAPQSALRCFGGDARTYQEFVWAGERKPREPSLKEMLRDGSKGMALAYFKYGYSQREIADTLGVSPMTVSRHLRAA